MTDITYKGATFFSTDSQTKMESSESNVAFFLNFGLDLQEYQSASGEMYRLLL